MRFPEVFVADKEVRKLQWMIRETISRSISNRSFSRARRWWRKTQEMKEGYTTNRKIVWKKVQISTQTFRGEG